MEWPPAHPLPPRFALSAPATRSPPPCSRARGPPPPSPAAWRRSTAAACTWVEGGFAFARLGGRGGWRAGKGAGDFARSPGCGACGRAGPAAMQRRAPRAPAAAAARTWPWGRARSGTRPRSFGGSRAAAASAGAAACRRARARRGGGGRAAAAAAAARPAGRGRGVGGGGCGGRMRRARRGARRPRRGGPHGEAPCAEAAQRRGARAPAPAPRTWGRRCGCSAPGRPSEKAPGRRCDTAPAQARPLPPAAGARSVGVGSMVFPVCRDTNGLAPMGVANWRGRRTFFASTPPAGPARDRGVRGRAARPRHPGSKRGTPR
jgi:hypothetical protein